MIDMTVVECMIHNKLAKLNVNNDCSVMNVVYDGKVISSTTGNVWSTLRGSGLELAYLKVAINDYIKFNTFDENFESMKMELD